MTEANDAIDNLARDGRRKTLIEDIRNGRLDRLPARVRERLPKDEKASEIFGDDKEALAAAFERVPFFLASPLEIALRTGGRRALEELLKRAKEKAPTRFAIWSSKIEREVALLPGERFREFRTFFDTIESGSLLTLALLLGDYESARTILRSGLVPSLENSVQPKIGIAMRIAESAELAAVFARVYDVPTPTQDSLGEAWDWIEAHIRNPIETAEADEFEDLAAPGAKSGPRGRL